MRRTATLAAALLLTMLTTAAPAAAHLKTVSPPGEAPGHGPTAVSQGWAQAHCHAQAPEQATANSGGVVTFTPDEALPCGPTENPGGNVHPHADG